MKSMKDNKATNQVPRDFKNSKVNNEAANLMKQFQENESRVEAKPLPLIKILLAIGVAWGVYFFMKHG